MNPLHSMSYLDTTVPATLKRDTASSYLDAYGQGRPSEPQEPLFDVAEKRKFKNLPRKHQPPRGHGLEAGFLILGAG